MVRELNRSRAGQRGGRKYQALVARRAGAWLVWWVLLMSFWVILDDSIAEDELLAGAAVAALAALLAELVAYQTATRFRMRAEWVAPALSLPGQVARDTMIVFGALWKRVAHGCEPPSGFREIPVHSGGTGDEAVTRRVLLVGGRSLAPNTFVLGIDRERGVMAVHQLVVNERETAR